MAVAALAVCVVAVLAVAGFGVWRVTSGGSGANIGTLDPAQFPVCAREGHEVAEYLLSGRPESLDPDFASDRAQILREPQASRGGLIRADADQVIGNCDSSKEAAVQAQASASAAAAASASASASAVSLAAQFAAACTALGGTVTPVGDSPECDVSYPGYPDNLVPLNANGTMNQGNYDANKAGCAQGIQNAASSAQNGNPWSVLPVFHLDTGICIPREP
jgi:hypothetical protein